MKLLFFFSKKKKRTYQSIKKLLEISKKWRQISARQQIQNDFLCPLSLSQLLFSWTFKCSIRTFHQDLFHWLQSPVLLYSLSTLPLLKYFFLPPWGLLAREIDCQKDELSQIHIDERFINKPFGKIKF